VVEFETIKNTYRGVMVAELVAPWLAVLKDRGSKPVSDQESLRPIFVCYAILIHEDLPKPEKELRQGSSICMVPELYLCVRSQEVEDMALFFLKPFHQHSSR
jgi:hypothetical protein